MTDIFNYSTEDGGFNLTGIIPDVAPIEWLEKEGFKTTPDSVDGPCVAVYLRRDPTEDPPALYEAVMVVTGSTNEKATFFLLDREEQVWELRLKMAPLVTAWATVKASSMSLSIASILTEWLPTISRLSESIEYLVRRMKQ